eukprot:CAMPEP_0170516242 /NCGR_PEP_ID=MMETSP0209-20121228/2517_1 /TAXON_ID=665100 ORGANISM="Litonotus pictus, Strain P1" /NCGR_SAMPLE_ID=MMETSP0209 /ASSEMBLY_ACC=CAM_ASM_000301 /LENGTH=319 /DNA_ID=CAMNT_0010801059 /DNA_START=10 /DNA_END=970 /DNA_ORIENTATION=+
MRFNKNEAWSFGKSGRNVVYGKGGVPGPSEYNNEINTGRRSPSWKMGQRYKNKALEDAPGVGRYDYKSSIGDGPRYSIKKAEYSGVLDKTNANPGPLDYEPHKDKVLRNNPAYSMSKKIQMKDKDLYPGPGQYQDPNLNNSPQYKFGNQSRENKLSSSNSPGAGQYDQNLNHLLKAPLWKMGSSERNSDDKEGKFVPGPGNYSPNYNGMKAPLYSLSKSTNINKNTNTNPGPGQYDTVDKRKDGITMKRRYYNKEQDSSPSPFDYNTDKGTVIKKSPAYRFSSAKRGSGDLLTSPGPSDYNSIDIGKKFPQINLEVIQD